ncbi:MAG: 3-isopropylmalate dehydratase small subunit [Magnetococcales bacterium]|nr:3-isopropylmalate dehydratase small subunit [Magnetococcales bacterium]NGZ28370.1 3-isopropylmalate dehydratase small subunit [Magnetococcales bacterium]
MEPFTRYTALVAPLDRANVDTDAIIPKQFLKSIRRSGFGPNLFDEWRYLDRGEVGKPNEGRPLNNEFILNQPQYKNAGILLTRDNFGCGSSREHAPWALLDYGFRAIIAPSYADIFFNNCFKNGILPVRLATEQVDYLFKQTMTQSGYQLTVDLVECKVITPNGQEFTFEVDPFRRNCLINGLDDIGLTLQNLSEIEAFEQQRRQTAPWAFVNKGV